MTMSQLSAEKGHGDKHLSKRINVTAASDSLRQPLRFEQNCEIHYEIVMRTAPAGSVILIPR